MGGVTIPRGDLVFAVLGSANRDERHFKDPDTLDLGREPNRHIQTLVNRFPNLRLSRPAQSLKWRTGFIIRGPKHLPVALSSGDGRMR